MRRPNQLANCAPAKLPRNGAQRPVALSRCLVAYIGAAGDLVGPGNHPLAGGPGADHGDGAYQDAQEGHSGQRRTKQLAQRQNRFFDHARVASHLGDSGNVRRTTIPSTAGMAAS